MWNQLEKEQLLLKNFVLFEMLQERNIEIMQLMVECRFLQDVIDAGSNTDKRVELLAKLASYRRNKTHLRDLAHASERETVEPSGVKITPPDAQETARQKHSQTKSSVVKHP